MEEKFSIEMNKDEMLRYYENKIVEDRIKSCSEFNTIVNLTDYNTKEIKLEKYKKKGVWALFGKKFGENVPWICLQVAKTTNIADEIKKDINCLKPSIDEKIKENKKNYVNQFGNIMFEYNDYEYPSSREHLYNKIACEYNTLMFICVSEEDKSAKRLDIEKYFAWRARALYWRNGGPYKKEKNYSEDDLNKIQEDTFMDIKLDEKIKENLDSKLRSMV